MQSESKGDQQKANDMKIHHTCICQKAQILGRSTVQEIKDVDCTFNTDDTEPYRSLFLTSSIRISSITKCLNILEASPLAKCFPAP